MLDWIVETPLEARTALVACIGLAAGSLLNLAIYRLAWNQRSISPWSAPPADAPPRHWYDRVPVAGWLFLRREWPLHGRAFWVRPLVIELGTALTFAWLYLWVIHGQLLPPEYQLPAATLHAQYVRLVLLVSLMIVATFIDFDEKTIPDGVTLPGTIAALALAALLPVSQLPTVSGGGYPDAHQLVVTSPSSGIGWSSGLGGPASWPEWLDGSWGLATALACYLGWCYAILPRTWTTRRGWLNAFRYLAASILRHGLSWIIFGLAVAGSLAIAVAWWLGGPAWQSLYSSLVGLAFGGGLIWAVRIIGSSALGKEAMGFGDVTLMSMIGAFLGWQPALIVFFLAPFAALVISVTQVLLTRRKDIAFGPYLCLAALLLVVFWSWFWVDWSLEIFTLGWLIPGIVAVCLVLMAAMLSLWRMSEVWGAEPPGRPEVDGEGEGEVDEGEVDEPPGDEWPKGPEAGERQL